MKRLILITLAAIGLLSIGSFLSGVLQAQGVNTQFQAEYIAGALSTCPTPIVGHYYYCEVTGVGLEESANGAAYAPLGGTAAAGVLSLNGKTGDLTTAQLGIKYSEIAGTPAPGVASFNGLTGPVTSVAANIKFSDLINKPTTLNCTSATHSNTGLSCPVGTLTLQ